MSGVSGEIMLEFTALACLKSSTDIPVCVLMVKGSRGAMEKEKMPAGCLPAYGGAVGDQGQRSGIKIQTLL